MTPDEMLQKLETALETIHEVSREMNTHAAPCPCCGVSVRDNMDDYNGSQALEACESRLSKLVDKLRDGKWQGRSLVPVVDASTLRRQR